MNKATIDVRPDQLCERLKEIHPDIGACGIDLRVERDEATGRWVVFLHRDGHELKTYLEPEDLEACQEGRQCVALGIQIGELKKNVGLL